MKINYLARIDPYSPTASGGGEAIMRELLTWGTGPFGPVENLKIITPDNTYDYNNDADFNIFCDVFNLPGQPGFSKEWLSEKLRHKKYFKFDNAYVDVCKKDYLPCNAECEQHCHPESAELYQKAERLFFLSPLHAKTVLSLLPYVDMANKSHVIRPTINTKLFNNKEFADRKIDYLYVAPLLPAKGILNTLKFLEDVNAEPSNVLFIGKNPMDIGVEDYGMKWKESVDYSELPGIYNNTKCLVHLPNWIEPMGRIVMEAALCGCNLAINENVGAASFDFELGNPDNYKDSIQEFWEYLK